MALFCRWGGAGFNGSALRSKQLLVTAGLYIFLPNSIFWVVCFWAGVERPIINLDYILCGLLFVYGWRKCASLLLIVFLLVDLLVIKGLVYPVVRLQDDLYLLSMLPYAAFLWQVAAIGAVFVLLVVVAVFFFCGNAANRLAALILLLLGVSVHAAQVSLDEFGSDFYRVKNTAAGSQFAYFANMRAAAVFEAFFDKVNPLVSGGSDARIAVWAKTDPAVLNKKILLIVVESWGVMEDDRIQQALLEPLTSRTDNWDWMKVESVPGNVATVAAELDKLCGLKTRYFDLKSVVEGFEGCLPWRLKGLGFKTVAIHGAAGEVYGRKSWYPRAGFDELVFQESSEWSTHCYSFPGVCDDEILERYVSRVFLGDERRFVYWLTLNTHTLYDERDIRSDFFDCRSFQLDENGEVCRMNKLHAQFFHGLAKVLSSPSMSGVEVLLVGDHSPPILDRNEYKKHVREGLVSQVHLRVK